MRHLPNVLGAPSAGSRPTTLELAEAPAAAGVALAGLVGRPTAGALALDKPLAVRREQRAGRLDRHGDSSGVAHERGPLTRRRPNCSDEPSEYATWGQQREAPSGGEHWCRCSDVTYRAESPWDDGARSNRRDPQGCRTSHGGVPARSTSRERAVGWRRIAGGLPGLRPSPQELARRDRHAELAQEIQALRARLNELRQSVPFERVAEIDHLTGTSSTRPAINCCAKWAERRRRGENRECCEPRVGSGRYAYSYARPTLARRLPVRRSRCRRRVGTGAADANNPADSVGLGFPSMAPGALVRARVQAARSHSGGQSRSGVSRGRRAGNVRGLRHDAFDQWLLRRRARLHGLRADSWKPPAALLSFSCCRGRWRHSARRSAFVAS